MTSCGRAFPAASSSTRSSPSFFRSASATLCFHPSPARLDTVGLRGARRQEDHRDAVLHEPLHHRLGSVDAEVVHRPRAVGEVLADGAASATSSARRSAV